MAAIFAFKCNCCGDIHEGSPSFGFSAPDHYIGLSDEQQAANKLSDDLCMIERDGGTDHFVRAVLEVPIHGASEPFLWGVWVSLSEKSFKRYVETFHEPVPGEGFFGWVCNDISLYPYEHSRAADVVVQDGRSRPKVILHKIAASPSFVPTWQAFVEEWQDDPNGLPHVLLEGLLQGKFAANADALSVHAQARSVLGRYGNAD